jgi:hypothetical protein
MARIINLPPSKVGKGLYTTKKGLEQNPSHIFAKNEISFDQKITESF